MKHKSTRRVVRLHLVVTPQLKDRMLALMQRLEATSIIEVIRRSIILMDAVTADGASVTVDRHGAVETFKPIL